MSIENPIAAALRDTCIVVSLQCSALGMSRTDKSASQDVVSRNEAVEGAARVLVSRLPGADKLHKELTSVQGEARKALYAVSMPLAGRDGWRILPNQNFDAFSAEVGQLKARFSELLEALAEQAPSIIEQAHANKGQLHAEIPDPEELVESYSFKVVFEPFADPSQFLKGNLNDAVAHRLAANAEKRLETACAAAQLEVLSRFLKPLQAYVDRIEKFEQREQEKIDSGKPTTNAVFRDSLLTNVQDLMSVMGSFNISNDSRFVELEKRLQVFANVGAADIRKDPTARQESLVAAKEALGNLNDWLGYTKRD